MQLQENLIERESSDDFIENYNQFIRLYNKQIGKRNQLKLENDVDQYKNMGISDITSSSQVKVSSFSNRQSLISMEQSAQYEYQPEKIKQKRDSPVFGSISTDIVPPVLSEIYLPDDSPVLKLYRLHRKPVTKILMVLILIFVPVINLLLFGTLTFYYCSLRRISKPHRQNLKKLEGRDPFILIPNCLYSEQICSQVHKNCHIIPHRNSPSAQNFIFNPKIMLSNQTEGFTTDVIVYNQSFYNFFFLFNREAYRVIAWLFLGVFLIIANCLMYVAILYPSQ